MPRAGSSACLIRRISLEQVDAKAEETPANGPVAPATRRPNRARKSHRLTIGAPRSPPTVMRRIDVMNSGLSARHAPTGARWSHGVLTLGR